MLVMQQAASSRVIIWQVSFKRCISVGEINQIRTHHVTDNASTTSYNAERLVLTGELGNISNQNNYIFIFIIKCGAKGSLLRSRVKTALFLWHKPSAESTNE